MTVTAARQRIANMKITRTIMRSSKRLNMMMIYRGRPSDIIFT